MKNSQKGFITLFITLAVVLLVCGGMFLYAQNRQEERSTTYSKTQEVAATNQPALGVEVPKQQNIIKQSSEVSINILSDTHKNFTETEKSLIERAKHSRSVMKYGYDEAAPKLKFYDDKTVVFCTPSEKVGCFLNIYNKDTLERMNKLEVLLVGNYIESDSYIIFVGLASAGPNDTVGEDNFIFYKKGMTDFKIIPNSTLSVSKTYDGAETYAKGYYDMGIPSYDFTFDEPTKTLTSSIFKRVNGNELNTKIRTVKFLITE